MKIGTQKELDTKLRVISDERVGTPDRLLKQEGRVTGARSMILQQYLLLLISTLSLETAVEKKLAAKLQDILHGWHGARKAGQAEPRSSSLLQYLTLQHSTVELIVGKEKSLQQSFAK